MQTNVNTSQGLAVFRSIDLDESEEEVKGSEGVVYSIHLDNAAVAARFVKLYDATAANVTVGTTTPKATFRVPATSERTFQIHNGIRFSTAITAAATTGIADNDTGAPAANDVVIHLAYA